ncbi:MAG: hypothetical protein HKN24_11250, partial [Acidimicrobiales bacterium]|nr:hypothetical protein [Acidimicrobiales bacterium]
MSVRVVAVVCVLAAAACSDPGNDASVSGTVPTAIPASSSPSVSTTTSSVVTTSTSLPTSTSASVASDQTLSDAVELAHRLGVERMLVRTGDGSIAVDGDTAKRSGLSAWTDGRFLYWTESDYDDETEQHSFGRSVAATFDWEIVCDFDQWAIHHATRRQDGTHVAGANRPWDWDDTT